MDNFSRVVVNETRKNQSGLVSSEASFCLPCPSATAYTLSTAVIVLNALEILAMSKRWRKITDFELTLFNLAIADFITGATFLSLIGIETYEDQKNTNISYNIKQGLYILLFVSIQVSVNFVMMIGIERLLAVRLPIKHRMFHMKRSRVHFAVALIWLFVISSCVIALLADKATNRFTTYTSMRLAFGYRVMLLLESAIILVLYSCLAFQVFKRKSELLTMNTHTATWKKERATLVVCLLVVTSFLACTTPFAVIMYKKELSMAENLALLSNSLINPLIYFFKTRIERHYRRSRNCPKINIGTQSGSVDKDGSR